MTETLYGIGVGPGDPECLTLGAVRKIRECEIILLPQEKEKCYAYQIVKQEMPEIAEKETRVLSFPMTKDDAVLEQKMEENAKVVYELLEKGKKLVFLTIGDPSVYATYIYLQDKVLDLGGRAQMISGVPSFCKVAARLGIPLGEKQEEIHVIPASYEIRHTMSYQGTRIYMKAGGRLGELCEMLREEQKKREKQGEYLQIYAVADCGLASEKVMRGLDELKTDSYLTVVVVKVRTKRSDTMVGGSFETSKDSKFCGNNTNVSN